jgi:LCP family protein required for cell wall assembly
MLTNKRNFKYILLAIGVLLICGLPAMGFAGYQFLTNTETPRATSTLPPPFVLVTPSPSEAAPLCNGPRTMFILLIGSDARGNNYATGLADSIRIVRVDFVDPGIKLLPFQRDLYVEIPGISARRGITHGKLNQAYLYGNASFGYYDGPGEGPGLLALTMEKNFGVRVDHYAAVNLQTFVRVVDAVGGIDIDLPYVVDGRVKGSTDNSKYFSSGSQHLDGYRTMILARLRPNGDIKRSHTQDLILQALISKLLSPSVLLQLPDLIDAFNGSLQTNLGQAEIAQLLCLTALLDKQKTEMANFPEELFTGTRVQDPVLGNTFVWQVDFDLLRGYVDDFYTGTWPESDPSP